MGYPKYDKEEARRVYDEAQAKATGMSPQERRNTNLAVFGAASAFVLFFVLLFIIIKTEAEAPDKLAYYEESIIIDRVELEGGKSQDFIIYYHTLDFESGSYKTKILDFNVKDTIRRTFKFKVLQDESFERIDVYEKDDK